MKKWAQVWVTPWPGDQYFTVIPWRGNFWGRVFRLRGTEGPQSVEEIGEQLKAWEKDLP